MSLLEAMAYGRCCVTSDIPECADVLGGVGFTFKKGDADDLGRVLKILLTDPNKTEKSGEAARKRVTAAFDWNSVVERTLLVYSGDR